MSTILYIVFGCEPSQNSVRIQKIHHFEKAIFKVGAVFKTVDTAFYGSDGHYAIVWNPVETVVLGFFRKPAFCWCCIASKDPKVIAKLVIECRYAALYTLDGVYVACGSWRSIARDCDGLLVKKR